MNRTIEQRLNDLIIERYENVTTFSKQTGIPRSTLGSIMKRGINNANVSTMRTICRTLQLSLDELVDGRIVSRADVVKPHVGNIDKSLSDFCRDLQIRDDLYMNGRPLDHDGAAALAELIELSVGFIQRRQ